MFILVYSLEIANFLRTVSHVGWGSVGDHILQEFYPLYLTRFRTYKIARTLNKNLGLEGASNR
jgi:hypothetical protein